MPILCCSLTVGQTYKVLWNFGSVPNDGAGPVASLISDGAGNLYGTTIGGGSASNGTVFELSPQNDGTWNETILYSFCGCTDGYKPQAGLFMDATGNLYGTASSGGVNSCPHGTDCGGTVFELSRPSQPSEPWTYNVLYTFCSTVTGVICEDGSKPYSQLIMDEEGRLYGTTAEGGNGHDTNGFGAGTVFQLSPSAGGWIENVLYSFCQQGTGRLCNDGATPRAGVVFDSSGDLLGTTEAGGSSFMGLVYELSPGRNGWTEQVLYVSFNGNIYAPVSFDSAGNLYSTTTNRAFQLNLKHHVARSISFSTPTGSNSRAGVLVDFQRNVLFGTAAAQGTNFAGTVWQVSLAGQMTPVYDFCSQPGCTDGSAPMAGLIEDRSGNLYGTTKLGGAFSDGVVFEIIP
jgi:uncharacterized repeat protein (TIGR03803 family)